MVRGDRIALGAAFVLFVVFFANVAAGAAGRQVFLDDVAEMLVLFASCTFFVVGVLIREARSERGNG